MRTASVMGVELHRVPRDLVVSSAQLAAQGVGPNAITRRVRDGRLTRMFRGVYRVGPVDGPWTWEAGALLACGEAAVLSHESAAALWGIRPRTDGPVQVTIARGHRAGQAGIRVHHARLTRGEVRMRHELRITSPARTLHDLATTLPQLELDRAVNEAQVLGLVTAAGLLSYLARSSRRQGARALREALRVEPRVTRSELEDAMLALLRRVDLPIPQTNAIVEGYVVDFFWPEQRVVVETDGYGPHGTPRRFETDRARDAHLTALGYRVLRFTWRQLTTEPEVVAARLATVLVTARAAPRPADGWPLPRAA
jgi:very-short-patch-repair endonuclease